MKILLIALGGFLLLGCTPTVKEVALYKGKKDVVVVKKGKFLFTEEDKSFIKTEAKRLGIRIPKRKEIEHHLLRLLTHKRSLEVALKRANLYIPYIKPILMEYGLPEELSLLPFIESGFNPFAVSKSGAGGIWQLMPATARRFGLKVGSDVDERFDLFKSTHAAAKYLKELHKRFGDWELVLAAYNCGEGCVSRKTMGKDFWKTKWALPEQTRKYVPLFFAALLIAKSPHRYGLSVNMDNLNIDKVLVAEGRSVDRFVKDMGIKKSTFMDLNPHIKGRHIPSGTYVYVPSRFRDISPSPPPAEVYKKPKKKKSVKKVLVAKSSPPKKVINKPIKKAPKLTPKRKPKEKNVKEELVLSKPKKDRPVKTDGRQPRRDRVVIRMYEEPVQEQVRRINLENGAVLYIKE